MSATPTTEFARPEGTTPHTGLPPTGRDGHGDEGDGRGPGDRPRSTRLPISNGKLAVGILVCSLSMMFIGWLAAYVVFRMTAGANWPPQGAPPLPSGLWASTLILLASSGSLMWSRRTVLDDDLARTKVGLVLTSLLGFAFLTVQAYLWLGLARQGLTQVRLYGDLFYLLTIAHGAHVLGGLVVLSWVTGRGLACRYSAASHEGIDLAGIYWHFLAIVWLVLFVVLYLID